MSVFNKPDPDPWRPGYNKNGSRYSDARPDNSRPGCTRDGTYIGKAEWNRRVENQYTTSKMGVGCMIGFIGISGTAFFLFSPVVKVGDYRETGLQWIKNEYRLYKTKDEVYERLKKNKENIEKLKREYKEEQKQDSLKKLDSISNKISSLHFDDNKALDFQYEIDSSIDGETQTVIASTTDLGNETLRINNFTFLDNTIGISGVVSNNVRSLKLAS